MFRKTLPVIASAVAFALFLAVNLTQGQDQDKQGKDKQDKVAAKGGGKKKGAPAPAMEIQSVKTNLYVISGAGGNTAVRVTNAGVIVVDTKNRGDNNYADLMDLIKEVTTQPVKFVVITHHHQDHSGNTQNFIDAGATVIAHDNEKAALATYIPPTGQVGAPTVTYSKDYTIKLGGTETRIYHWGGAHTGGDSIVYFPDLKVVAAGDTVVGTAPAPDFGGSNNAGPTTASMVEWRATLDAIERLDFDTVIPGHPPKDSNTMTRLEFVQFKKSFDTLVSRAQELVRSGTPKSELLAKIKTNDLPDGWAVDNATWQARLDGFYADLQKAPVTPAKPVSASNKK
jgi:cyclase